MDYQTIQVVPVSEITHEIQAMIEARIAYITNPTPEVMTVSEVAAYLRCSQAHIYKLIKEGLPFTEKCGDKRFIKSEVDQWLKK